MTNKTLQLKRGMPQTYDGTIKEGDAPLTTVQSVKFASNLANYYKTSSKLLCLLLLDFNELLKKRNEHSSDPKKHIQAVKY